MKIKVRYFALYQDLLGKKGESVEMPEGTSLKDLVDQILGSHPQRERFLAFTRFAVNREYAPLSQFLNEGDEIAFLPPVAGG
ncbi:MAG: MoaD/ThiS family protein [Deltaproteobacteria bacterium]|nr:MoaD/ThiS family protein [Deltaproteobacteria bacterium]